jgi:hypothetical protein
VIAERFNPGNGIRDRLIEAGVLPVKLAMGFTAAVDQAVGAGCLLGAEALHRRPSWQIAMAGFLALVCIESNIEISRYREHRSPLTQPHIHRLKPLHPAILALLAVLNGVPITPALDLWRLRRTCSRPDDIDSRQLDQGMGVPEQIDSAPKLPPSG